MAYRMLPKMPGGRIPVNIGEVKEIELETFLGAGAFGQSWKAKDTGTNTPYVLKIIEGLKPNGVMAERVRLEASVRVPSKHVVPACGLCEWDPNTFLILFEYFQARTLSDVLKDSPLKGERRRSIFGQVLQGVSDAHRQNLIHRDLKPDNILVGDDGIVRIMDFGISKFKGADLTLTGQFLGTYPYAAPEMFLFGVSKFADVRTDMYSLGQILYELAMGEHSWTRQGWTELRDVVDHIARKPRPNGWVELGDFRCEFYRNAAPVIERMTRVDPSERYGSVAQVAADLGDHLAAPPSPPRDIGLRSPLLIVESGTNKSARSVIGLADGERRHMGRYDLAGGDGSISRKHLEFKREEGHYFVRDLKSKNGSLLRAAALTPDVGWVKIQHGDRIKVGDVFLRFAFLRPDA